MPGVVGEDGETVRQVCREVELPSRRRVLLLTIAFDEELVMDEYYEYVVALGNVISMLDAHLLYRAW